ncbi:hypothetical protein GCM10027296_39000 [Chitinimonas naiadis]
MGLSLAEQADDLGIARMGGQQQAECEQGSGHHPPVEDLGRVFGIAHVVAPAWVSIRGRGKANLGGQGFSLVSTEAEGKRPPTKDRPLQSAKKADMALVEDPKKGGAGRAMAIPCAHECSEVPRQRAGAEGRE